MRPVWAGFAASPSSITKSEWARLVSGDSDDAESDRLILFAGGSPWFMYGDTWAYDYDTDTWEEMSPDNSPSPRAMYATAYDAESSLD